MIASQSMNFDHMMKIAYTQTITINTSMSEN